MKNSFQRDIGLAFLRIATSVALLTHGIPKLLKLFGGGEIKFADPIGLGVVPSLVLAVVAEFICPLLIILGFKTRWATIPPTIVMAVAALIVHGDDPFSGKEKAVLFFIVFVAIALLGPGRFSLDKR